ncbi:MAG TPA: efflux transporter outer membrane subunit [Gemmatimonadaceae bacterium]|nr:efflux transporter outer membrane subunit [Gemmatimonadaceae bacterium]
MRERTRNRIAVPALVAPAVLLVLAGCSFAPAHTRPELAAAPIYPVAYAGDSLAGAKATAIGWRDFIVDPRLEALVDAALENNRDMAIAVARVEEARGLHRIQDANLLPTVGATGGATRSRAGAGSLGLPAGGDAITIDRYSVGVGVSSFELDFWGRVRNLSEAARAQYLSTVQGQRAFRLSLVRQVAAVYLASLEAAERVRLAEATVESRREGLRIARVRFESGITSALDYRQAESLLTQAEAQLAALGLARAQAENALAVLVGGPVEGPLPAPRPLTEQMSDLAIEPGLPSELLVARPDIIAAEEQLRAARANIGAARAAFFPSISLTGTLGYASTELDGLFGDDGLTWSFGPSINLPIFDRGRRRANVTVAEAREDLAVANYERTVQGAFQEVADALAGRRYLAEQVSAQERSTEAQRAIAELARTRYDEGVVNYLQVLDAERNLFAAEQALLQLRRAQADNAMALYVALGGGLLD